ncbi:MAG: hypothetical protein U5K79_25660 [Cyclobacteriaceae bacterium]|nr:hypothetical protein [Cyclobacteriaceae bacterium]
MRTIIDISQKYSVVAVIFVTSFTACGGKDDPITCGATWASDLQPELNAINTAMTNYISDQSVANCNALKSCLLRRYID